MLKIETVEETVYLEVNALEGYARKEYVDDAIDGVNSSISNIESNVSAINSELEKKADKSDIEGLATERYVDEKIDNIPEVDLTPYATTESVDEKLKLKADVSDLDSLATKEELNSKADKSEVLYPSDIEGLATEEYVDTKFNSIDLSPYATKEELEEKADISYVDGKVAEIKIPSIEGLATEQYVDNKVSSIDLSEYALTSDLSSAIGSINNDLGLKADKTELEGLATENYVNEKIDEKDIGITESELISKSVGSDKWLREGAYGLGVNSSSSKIFDFINGESKVGFYDAPKSSEGNPLNENGVVLNLNRGVTSRGNWGMFLIASDNSNRIVFRRQIGGSQGELGELLHTLNTSIDSNGVLHTGTKTPLDTLNTSDMTDTVVDNDLLTVTSGAVYRAIAKLQNKVDELEGQVNELKSLQ